MNVLVNAYACSPNWGSEPGMSWNWIKNLSKYCNLYIITEGEWAADIESAVALLPHKSNLHFYYNPVSDNVRKMCWNQGDWRFYYYYRKWQKKTLKIAEEICARYSIDIIHQLNMVGFREPGLLWKIKGPKYVWGPIGGMENIPTAYLQGAGFKQSLFCRLKNLINTLQYSHQPNLKKAIEHSDVLVSAVKGVKVVLKDIYGRDSILINETGCFIDSNCPTRISRNDDCLKLLWVGKFDFRKQLNLAIQTMAMLNDLNIELHICGTGSEEQVFSLKKFAKEMHVEDKCIWHGIVTHSEIQSFMANSDIFFFTSIMEATSTVILEAISSGLPIVCFDTCGFGPIVTDSIGRIVDISNPSQSVEDFSKHIRYLFYNRELLNEMSKSELEYRKQLSWDFKAEQMFHIYEGIID